MGGGGSSSPPPPLGRQGFQKRWSGYPGAVPSAISTPASALPTPAGGEFGGSRPLPPASPRLQHQQQAAARAGPRLTHLPTGRGRWLLRSGRRGSGACISGKSGLCCSAPRRASSGGEPRRGTVHRGVAGPGGRSAEARAPGDRRLELAQAAAAGFPQASPRRVAAPLQPCSFARGKGIRCHRLAGPAGGGELWMARHGADARL